MATAGLTSTGFVPLSLQEVKAQIESDLLTNFGTTLDLSSTSVLGNLTGILASAYADLWSATADLYGSQFPAGASGVAVDNILAINNMTRLPAVATTTNPAVVTASDGTVKHGFVLLGTPGTVVPAGSLFTNGAATPATFALNSAVTIGAASQGQQVIYFTNQPTSGAYALQLTSPAGEQATTPGIPYSAQPNVTTFGWSTAPTSGSYVLGLGGQNTGSIPYNASAAAVQAAINAVAGYAGATVLGSAGAGFSISWALGFVPRVTPSGNSAPNSIVDAVSAIINSLAAADGTLPFTDVAVGGTQQAMTLAFGAFPPQSGQPSTAAAGVPRVAVASTTLANGAQVTNVTPQTMVVGNPSQGVGQATCVQTGAVSVLAGQLSTITTPVAGLSSVNNDLDCLTGRDVETDNQALARLRAQQGSASSGSLAAIIKRVQAVAGVTQVVGAQNTSNAAQQIISFASQPTTGLFNLLLAGQATPLLAYNAAAADLQLAIRSLAGFDSTTVSTSGTLGFAINFGGSVGSQGVALAQFPTNTTGQALTAYFGRSAHSVELTVQGGDDADIAQALLDTVPAGVSTYSSPLARTTANTTKGSAVIVVASASGVEPGQSVEAAGVPLGATVASVANSNVTLTASANGTGTNVPVVFDTAPVIADAAGNPMAMAFSRPSSVVVWVSLNLITDRYTTPGDSTSDINASSQFNLSTVAAIKQTIMDTINATPIGGAILINGTQGLLNSFRSTPGIVNATIAVGRSASPTQSSNLYLSSNEAPLAESYSVQIQVV